ncbi:MAG: hypothetical protein LBS49_11275 [Candidatus Accumulibacter sp.]|jgi:hypothetical protein|nr:hypothetical protein [Accumulibacter sp.]
MLREVKENFFLGNTMLFAMDYSLEHRKICMESLTTGIVAEVLERLLQSPSRRNAPYDSKATE